MNKNVRVEELINFFYCSSMGPSIYIYICHIYIYANLYMPFDLNHAVILLEVVAVVVPNVLYDWVQYRALSLISGNVALVQLFGSNMAQYGVAQLV